MSTSTKSNVFRFDEMYRLFVGRALAVVGDWDGGCTPFSPTVKAVGGFGLGGNRRLKARRAPAVSLPFL